MDVPNQPAADTPVVPEQPVIAETPVETPAAAAATEETAAQPFDHTTDPGILAAEEAPKEEVKAEAPVEEKPQPETPAEAAKPEEQAPVEQPAEEPANYEFKWPENFQTDKASIDAAVEVFRELKIAPEAAQKLIDQHVKATQALVDAQPEQWQRAFADTRKAWREEGMKDPVIGGARWESTVQAAKEVLANTALVPKSERDAFVNMLKVTGVSDHPQMIKFLFRLSNFMREPASPPPAQQPPKGNGGQVVGRRNAILTHPSSTPGN